MLTALAPGLRRQRKESSTRRRACLLTGALVAACTTPREQSAYQVSDSAGIRIVTNAQPSRPPDSGWVVDSAPLVGFGRATEDSLSMLLLPEGAVRLSDGRVVVGDRGSDNLKFFAADGRFERSIGREGDGPGEFRYIARLMGCNADSVFADDIARHAISVIAPDGGLGRTFALRTAEPGLPAYEISCNRHGDLLTSGWGSMARREEPYRPEVPVSIMIAPKTLPASVRLLADSDGYLWVQRYPDAGQRQGAWDIYQTDGVLFGRVSLPPALYPVEIGSDYVLGLATGEDGSQWVQLHRLRR